MHGDFVDDMKLKVISNNLRMIDAMNARNQPFGVRDLELLEDLSKLAKVRQINRMVS